VQISIGNSNRFHWQVGKKLNEPFGFIKATSIDMWRIIANVFQIKSIRSKK